MKRSNLTQSVTVIIMTVLTIGCENLLEHEHPLEEHTHPEYEHTHRNIEHTHTEGGIVTEQKGEIRHTHELERNEEQRILSSMLKLFNDVRDGKGQEYHNTVFTFSAKLLSVEENRIVLWDILDERNIPNKIFEFVVFIGDKVDRDQIVPGLFLTLSMRITETAAVEQRDQVNVVVTGVLH